MSSCLWLPHTTRTECGEDSHNFLDLSLLFCEGELASVKICIPRSEEANANKFPQQLYRKYTVYLPQSWWHTGYYIHLTTRCSNYQIGEDLRKWYSRNGVSILAIGHTGQKSLTYKVEFLEVFRGDMRGWNQVAMVKTYAMKSEIWLT